MIPNDTDSESKKTATRLGCTPGMVDILSQNGYGQGQGGYIGRAGIGP